jgi:integrase
MDNKDTSKRFNFTKASIEALPLPSSGRVRYYDTEIKGLCLYVYGSGKRVFYFYGRVNGKPEDIKIGEYPMLSHYVARANAKTITGEAQKGINPNGVKRALREELTLGAMFDKYLIDYAIPNGVKTTQDMRDNFDRYLGEVPDVEPKKHGKKRVKPEGAVNWQNRKLSAITTQDVKKLHVALNTLKGKTTANRVLELLSAIYSQGNKLETSKGEKVFKGENPCKGIVKYKLRSRERFLQDDEMKRFYEAVAKEPNESIRDYIFMSLATGARKANVLAMRWDEVNLSSGVWTIPEVKTKNGDPTKVQLTELAKEILERRIRTKTTDFVFSGEGITGHLTSPKRAWARILERAELKDLTLHDLRRTIASWLINSGASLQVVGAVLGHKDAKSTEVYARLKDAVIRADMERAQKAMLVAGGITPKADVLEFKKLNG